MQIEKFGLPNALVKINKKGEFPTARINPNAIITHDIDFQPIDKHEQIGQPLRLDH